MGGIAEETVIPANAPIQIQVSSVVIRVERLALDHFLGLVDFGELTHERSPDQHPGQRDQEDACVAQRLHPLLHERLAQSERQDRQHDKGSDGADFERSARRPLGASDHERRHRNGESHQHRGLEGDVADQYPINDPRREAHQNAHGGSVYVVGSASTTVRTRFVT